MVRWAMNGHSFWTRAALAAWTNEGGMWFREQKNNARNDLGKACRARRAGLRHSRARHLRHIPSGWYKRLVDRKGNRPLGQWSGLLPYERERHRLPNAVGSRHEHEQAVDPDPHPA